MARQVTDELLRALTQEWVETIPEQYPEKERPKGFSPRFHWRMRSVLREAKRMEAPPAVEFRPVRFGLALLAAVLLTATVAMAFPAVRERVFRAVWEKQEDYTRLYYERIDGEETYPGKAQEEGQEFLVYRFSYLPEGFSLEEYAVLGHFHHEAFSNEEGLSIGLDQEWLGEGGPVGMTGNVEPEEILLNGVEPAWLVDREGLKSVHWDDGVYAFGVTTNLSREETVKLAESLVPMEDPFADVAFSPYRAAWLPEGYALAEAETGKDSARLRWEGPDGSSLTLDQIWWEWDAFEEDWGEVRPEYRFILESQDVKLLERQGKRSFYWDFGEYSFRLSSDSLSVEELTKIVVNLRPAGKEAAVFSPYHMTDLPEGFRQTGNGYTGGMHYEIFSGYDQITESGGIREGNDQKIDFTQQPLEAPRGDYVIDPETVEGRPVTLEGGRAVWVLDDPPEEKTGWTRYSYAVWWEEDGYFLSLWSSLPWEETAKVAEGIQKM